MVLILTGVAGLLTVATLIDPMLGLTGGSVATLALGLVLALDR